MMYILWYHDVGSSRVGGVFCANGKEPLPPGALFPGEWQAATGLYACVDHGGGRAHEVTVKHVCSHGKSESVCLEARESASDDAARSASAGHRLARLAKNASKKCIGKSRGKYEET